METAMPAAASTREQTTADVSPLLRLPDELLSKVIAEVQGDAGWVAYAREYADLNRHHLPSIARTCRRLLPIVRAQLYRQIFCRGLTRCRRLIATIKSKLELGAMVKTLYVEPLVETFGAGETFGHISVDYEDYEDYEDYDTDEVADHAGIPQIKRLLSLLPNLESLILGRFDVDDGVALLARVRTLAHLKSLELRLEDSGLTPEAPGDYWQALLRLPNLMSLSLQPGLALLPHVGLRVNHLECLRSLSLARYSAPSYGLLDLGALAPKLERLEFLDNPGRAGNPNSVLLTAPRSLKVLHLLEESDCYVEAALPNFSSLTELVICGGRTFAPDRLLRYLSTSRISKLEFLPTFGNETSVDDAFLLAIVQGDLRPKSLRLLFLNHYSPHSPKDTLRRELGKELRAVYPFPVENYRTETRYNLEYWTLKRPTGSTEAGLLRVIAAAEQVGVAVCGSALDSIGWEDAFQSALGGCLFDRLFPPNAQETFLQILGAEGAARALREQASLIASR